ncbi:DNA translocase FtsK 4TM domain-containing protein, partial [Bacteroidales bacterium OttesenSCG-928-L03]|nr:DNA translocase FtsK 4TM domain-containing protein [Bacteroidales bacterium OttesenSCG-928-L03]
MAKRKLAPKDNKKEKEESKLLTFLRSNTTHYLAGIIILAFALYASISMVSFFFTGAADQSKIESGVMDHASNWTGTKGAKLSYFLMTDWFGVSMFFLLAFLFLVGLRLIKARYTPLLRYFILFSLLTIWTSVALSFFFGSFFKETAVYIGGKHGLVLSGWLVNQVGIPGTFLILLVSLILIMILITPKTTPFLTRITSSPKWRRFFSRKDRPEKIKREKKKKPQPEEEEDDPFIPEETEPTILVVDKEDKLDPFTKVEMDEFEVVKPMDEDYTESGNKDSTKKEEPSFEVNMTPDEAADRLIEELGVYDPTLDLAHYEVPTLDLLKKYSTNDNQIDMEEQNENKNKIIQTLAKFNVHIKSIKATVGPTITLYEIVPEDGIKIAKIRGLEDDIAMNLAALGIRIIAPIPGKGTIGIEVPNKDPQIVSMHSIIASKKFQESKMELPLALGKT